ncbi:unnamed protein product [Diamesa serratosioi]
MMEGENLKKSDSLAEESFDSWTILSNSGILPISGKVTVLVNDDDVDPHKENKNSTIEESVEKKLSKNLQVPDADENDSDGISVISDNDVFKISDVEDIMQPDKLFTKLHINKFAMKNLLNDVLEKDQLKYVPITPPQTPYENKSTTPEKEPKAIEKKLLKVNNQAIQTASSSLTNPSSVDSFRIFMILTLAGILVATIGIIANVKVDVQTTNANYEHRITNLLLENQLLRVKLEILELQNIQKQQQTVPIEEEPLKVVDETLFHSPIVEEVKEEKPIIVTKKVYSGEEDKIIEILDSRYLLPPYCYFTQEDDLFYDFNVKSCENKKKKLAKKLRNLHKDKSTGLLHQFGLQDETADKSKRTVQQMPKFDIFDLIGQMDDDDSSDDEPTESTDALIEPIVEEVQEIKRKCKPCDDNNKENKDKQRKNDKSPKKCKNERKQESRGLKAIRDFENWKDDTKKLPRLKNKKKAEYESSGSGDKKLKDEDKWNRRSDKTTKQRNEKADNEWLENRGNSREEARKQKKEDKSNWILERGNEREINRINGETTAE